MQFTPIKRTAIDGKMWYCIYDNKNRKFSTLLCFGKYKTRKAAETAIKIYMEE